MERDQISVSTRTATVYRNATPAQQRRAEAALLMALISREEAVGELVRLMNDVGHQAQEEGLTPELLEEILNESG